MILSRASCECRSTFLIQNCSRSNLICELQARYDHHSGKIEVISGITFKECLRFEEKSKCRSKADIDVNSTHQQKHVVGVRQNTPKGIPGPFLNININLLVASCGLVGFYDPCTRVTSVRCHPLRSVKELQVHTAVGKLSWKGGPKLRELSPE